MAGSYFVHDELSFQMEAYYQGLKRIVYILILENLNVVHIIKDSEELFVYLFWRIKNFPVMQMIQDAMFPVRVDIMKACTEIIMNKFSISYTSYYWLCSFLYRISWEELRRLWATK